MPLTLFQKDIVKLLSANRSIDSYLAGAAALHIEPNSIRFSNDLDYFHDSEIRVAEAFEADKNLLKNHKYSVITEMHQPGYIRSIIQKSNQSTKIEWAHDSMWRFFPIQFSEELGYILSPIDLACNKVLALAGRDEARDYLDVIDIHHRILPLGALCWAACGKDPGFTPYSLLELLQRRGKYQIEDFKRLHLNITIDLPQLKSKWVNIVQEAKSIIDRLPITDVGCIYWSINEQKIVCPPPGFDSQSFRPIFGKLGGVLPKFT